MKLDPKKTAMLALDLQIGILGLYPNTESVLPPAQRALEFARSKGFQVVHVGLGFTEGYPELPQFETPFERIRKNQLFIKGTPSSEFHPSLVKAGDHVLYKQRVGAFSENHLQLILRSRGVEHLVMFGIATSGIVLSTVRRAFDLDYRMSILSDACFDGDPEVHRVLIEKVLSRQATVLETDAFIAQQK